MQKSWKVISLLLIVFILSSCSTPTGSVSPSIKSTPTIKSFTLPTPEPTQVPTLPASSAPAACKVLDTLMPVIPKDYQPSIPAIDGKKDWVLGDINAPVSIIEYSDYQCPYCQHMTSIVDEFVKKQGNNISFAYRHFPLSQHEKAAIAAQASEAAGLQGKFWEMHRFLFEKSQWDLWILMTVDEFQTYLKNKAAPSITGLDTARFSTDLNSTAIVEKIKTVQKEVQALGNNPYNGIQGTPTFYIFIKGQIYNAPPSITIFQNIINLSKLDDQRIKECPVLTVDNKKSYQAVLKTEKGDIVIKLYPDKAPAAVNSFIFLAKKGYYDGVTFHRVVKDFIAQTGDPSNSGMGGPGYQLGTEITADMNFSREGLVGMTRGDEPDTNNSQFFITLAAIPNLTRRYTTFGEVVSGMDVVKKLTPRDVNTDENPVTGDKIISVTIEEK